MAEVILQRHLVSSPRNMAKVLAKEIDAYVRTNKLGYYPALNYFRGRQGVDQELLKVVEETGLIVCRLAEELLISDLKPAFSNVQIQSIKPIAFSLPPVRLTTADHMEHLVHHLTVSNIKIGMVASSIEKLAETDDIGKIAERKIWRWLQEDFESIKVVSATIKNT